MPLVDCDVHAVLPSITALRPYLPLYWQEQITQTGFRGPQDRWYPFRSVAARDDLTEAVPASRVELLQRDVLDATPGLTHAILHCDCAVDSLHNPDAAAALATALNDWLMAEWLARDPRLRAAIVVPAQFPELAAAEIQRRVNQPGFVQVLLPARSEAPYGSRNFRPLWAAAAAANLPVALHFGGAPGNPSTPVGWPSYWLEEYIGMSSVFQTQLLSLVSSGWFELFPDLHVILAESGVTWLPAMLWRLDKNWKGLRREIPWVGSLPSEYIHDRISLTTAPLDLPVEDGAARDILGRWDAVNTLLYASDYPHAHGVDPQRVLELAPADRIAQLRFGNARKLYRF